ncbi:helix-turn-helix transcriptional regulator [Salipiger thiooxidans]|uniref:helix-turn-helix transcriptional regulator n=1 Tax=Salipiger thiooxidans TaxID=282683 RepID=UPI001CD4E324|nr:LuxR C-terminal-related transcriptional regulator [Salipiger thiooxidans]MCA0848620.1 LuxR C-terminal-related transcriptional regulator [Salipiger thiooxidans]
MSPAAESDGALELIDDCLACCGRPEFLPRLAELVRSLGPRQLMVFELSAERASCLVSANFSALRLGEALAARYLDGWFRQDPLLPRLLAVLMAGATRRLAVYLYAAEDRPAKIAPALARILGRLVLMHFEGLPASATPAPLALLSEREAQVCMGILDGRKAEIIAGDMGVTVSTYRRRAYEKLGISSRGALFALCRPR